MASRFNKTIGRFLIVLFMALGEWFSGTAAAQTDLTFPDPNLEAAIRSALNKPDGPISSEDLQALSSLSASGREVLNLSGLEWARNLMSLDLSYNSISELSSLKGLTNLIQLSLEGNRISDLSALARLGSLSSLNVGDNQIGNISVLSRLTNLTSLWLYRNPLRSLTPLTSLSGLTSLIVYNSGVADIQPLAVLTNLSYLELRWNGVTNANSVLAGLTNLSTLYLGGNSISNLNFLQNLRRLSFLNLDHDPVSDLSPLAGLNDLSGLDVSYSGLTNLTQVVALTNLSSLYLSGNSISNVAALRNLSGLGSLSLSHNFIEDPSPLAELPGLAELELSWNPIGNHAALAGLSNLSSLWLEGNSISNLNFMQGMRSLKTLGIGFNRLDGLAVLEGLTNLVSVLADYNLLTDLSGLDHLPQLSRVQLVGNLLDLTAGSAPVTVIKHLQGRGVSVSTVPQNDPPTISLRSGWIIAADATSALGFEVFDDITSEDQLVVAASSSNPELIPDSGILLSGTNQNRTLRVSPAIKQTGTATITLRVSDDAGLSIVGTVLVSVVVQQPVDIPDRNLEGFLRQVLGKPTGALNNVDLISLSELYLTDPAISNLSGLEWATNLRTLFLSGDLISSLAPLQNLNELSSLNLYKTSVSDLSSLEGLANLTSLSLYGNAFINYGAALPGLRNLSSLYLGGNSLSDLGFLENLTGLAFLGLDNNRITDLSPLAGLRNLHSVGLRQNRITNIVALQNLPELSDVDVSLNLLDLSANSAAMTVVENLQSQGVIVQYLPQREPPVIEVRTNWYVAANSTASISFRVRDTVASREQLEVRAGSSDTGLVPNGKVETDPISLNWILSVTPAPYQIGAATISLAVTNDAGLGSEAWIEVIVLEASNVSLPDPSLEAAVRLAIGKFQGPLTTADLLALSELTIKDAKTTNLLGLEWASNLRTLTLSGNSISSLTPLQHLTGLSALSVYNTGVRDLSPIGGLTNLVSLNLRGNPITNYSAVLPGLSDLSGVDLGGNGISNLDLLENLTQLTSLILDDNRITDLSPLAGLRNLNSVDLRQNRITNIGALQNLAQLSGVDVSLNLLDLGTNSSAMTVVESLQSEGVVVEYLPQREPPVIEVRPHWYVAANATALLSLRVLDNGPSGEPLAISASSSDPSLVPNITVIESQDTRMWTLRATPASGRTGTTTLTLRATNEVGLGTIRTVLVTVVVPQPLDSALFNTDLTWTTYGDAPWFAQNVVTPEGLLAGQSGAIGEGEESVLETTLTGPRALSFWWKVSSEAGQDWLEFYVDGILQSNRISGEVDWHQQTIILPAGTHTLGWRYFKETDSESSIGWDAAWLAEIKLNYPPVLAVAADQLIEELSQLVVTNTASDADLTANLLSYRLVSPPEGASIDSQGVIRWTPSEAQGPGTNSITTVVTDNGIPALSATNQFTVVVKEVNRAPILPVHATQTINELTLLTVINTAGDADLPPEELTYRLVNPPAGASITTNGVISWTPGEAQGPSTNTITTVVTDKGIPALSVTNSFTVVVNEVNTAPVLLEPTDKVIHGLATLLVTNAVSDLDLPTNTLTFSLLSAPGGVSLDPSSGVLSWTPTEAQLSSTNLITVRVADNGSPPLNDTASFTVIVADDEVNQPPVLRAIADQSIDELSTLVLTNTAADPDIPANQLTFTLLAGPAGMSLDSDSGVLSWTPSEAQGPSTNLIRMKVSDNGLPALSHTNGFTLVVRELNSAPVLSVPPTQTIDELSTLVLTNTATDPDDPANAMTFNLVSAPAGVSLDSATGVLSWTPTEAQGPSTNLIRVKVTDNGLPALSHTNSFAVVVNEVNRAPVLRVPLNKAIHGLATLVLTNTATDPDLPANGFTYNLVSAPAGASLDPGSGVLTWTPTQTQSPSTNLITVRVTDNGSPPLSDTASFTVTVADNEANHAPVLTVPPNQTLDELHTLILTNTATDTDVPANSLAFRLVSAPAGMIINTNTGVLVWTPTEDQGPSTNLITVQVTDNGTPPLNATNSFTVTVSEVNSAPVLPVQATRTINELTLLTVTNTASDGDLPANGLTYQLVNPPAGANLAANGVIRWTPSETQGPGSHTFTTIVTDNGTPALSATNSFTVLVNEVNSAPGLTVPANQTIQELSSLVLTNIATDADIPANTLTFSLLSPPAGMTLDSNTGVLSWTPSETQGPSTNLITVKVTDNGVPARSRTESFTVVVNEMNRAPVLTVPPFKVIHGLTTLVLTNVATDPDLPANTLTFSLLSAPDGVNLDRTSGVLSWTPTETQLPSTNLITVRVTDNGSPPLSDTANFTVIVTDNEVNHAPVLTAIADQSIDELSTLVLANPAADTDVPADNLIFELLSPPAGMTLDSNTGVLSWTPTEAQGPSTNLITVRVTDDGVPPLSATNTFTVVVREVNRAPLLTVPPNQTLNELSTLVLTNTATDPDIPANTLTFSLVSPPAGMIIDSHTGVLSWTPSEAQGPSTNLIMVKVTDDGVPALSHTNSFTVIVNEINKAPAFLNGISELRIDELALLVLDNPAKDPDLPANALTWSLISAPAGMTIHSALGFVLWTPTEAQGPGTNLITIKVTDDGSPPLSVIKNLTVIVDEVNSPPVLTVPPNQTINELNTLVLTNTATDTDLPANTLTFALVNGPSGVAVNPTTGLLSWTPSEAQGPSTNTITVKLTDNGMPALSVTNSFTVVVNELNSAPVLTVPVNQTINEESTLVVTNTATDTDLPANMLTFALVSGPSGVAVNPATGLLSWTPTEAQGPSTNTIKVKVTDNGKPALSHTNSFTVFVNEVNTAPVLALIRTQLACAGIQLRITNAASDSDIPPNLLSYSLDPGSPAGANINPTDGVLTWKPRLDQVGSTNIVSVRVKDNGVPNLSDVKSFTVVVVSAPVIEGIDISGDAVTITWSALEGIIYRVQFKSDQSESTWIDLPGDVTAQGPTAMKTDVIDEVAQRYYRVVIVP